MIKPMRDAISNTATVFDMDFDTAVENHLIGLAALKTVLRLYGIKIPQDAFFPDLVSPEGEQLPTVTGEDLYRTIFPTLYFEIGEQLMAATIRGAGKIRQIKDRAEWPSYAADFEAAILTDDPPADATWEGPEELACRIGL